MIIIHYVEDVLLAGTPLCGEQKPQGVTSAIEAVTCQTCKGLFNLKTWVVSKIVLVLIIVFILTVIKVALD